MLISRIITKMEQDKAFYEQIVTQRKLAIQAELQAKQQHEIIQAEYEQSQQSYRKAIHKAKTLDKIVAEFRFVQSKRKTQERKQKQRQKRKTKMPEKIKRLLNNLPKEELEKIIKLYEQGEV